MEFSLHMPCKGILLSLSQVPDPVFSEKMVGDGFAIDPLEDTLYSPVQGIVKNISKTKHAITIETEKGINVIIHFGLESIVLDGRGIEIFVKKNNVVGIKNALMKFDISYISPKIKSFITPIIISDYKGIALKQNTPGIFERHSKVLSVDNLNKIDVFSKNDAIDDTAKQAEQKVIINNLHGIHARPAAKIAKAAKAYKSFITINDKHKKANAKSLIDIMSLGLKYQEEATLKASGNDADIAIKAISDIILNLHDENETIVAEEKDLSTIGKVNGKQYFGIAASKGQAIGRLIGTTEIDFVFDKHSINTEVEQNRLSSAIKSYSKSLDNSLGKDDLDKEKESIISAHIELLKDEKLLDMSRKYIFEENNTAEFAWQNTSLKIIETLKLSNNKIMVDRCADIKDIYKQILLLLTGQKTSQKKYPENTILFAQEFTLSDILHLDKNIIGLVSVKGGRTSHVAIVAGNKCIPLIIQVNTNITNYLNQEVILDADSIEQATIEVDPTVDKKRDFLDSIKKSKDVLRSMQESVLLPATTRDRTNIECYMNINSVDECKNFLESGADGIGLFRTEFIYINKKSAPSEDEQFQIYKNIINSLEGRPTIIRTLDAGGDKEIPYLNLEKEMNPFLGIRGIRLTLAHPDLLRTQIRALIRTESSNLQIMFPMVSNIDEFRKAKAIYNEEHEKLGVSTRQKLGIMVEVPSVIMQAEIFAKEVDFMSVGTNDLTQYLLAMDREHNELAKEIDHLHPAVLIALSRIQKVSKEYNTKLSVCGMMASDEEAIAILVGLGISNFSMRRNVLAQNKAFIRKLDKAQSSKIASKVLELDNQVSVRQYIQSFLKQMR
jgi:phosphoenolpyruvate-protein phosphotransferase